MTPVPCPHGCGWIFTERLRSLGCVAHACDKAGAFVPVPKDGATAMGAACTSAAPCFTFSAGK